ncbi:hypothetical protein BBH88_03315 [Planococcus antarcticus DSM 14505]|uniref:Uncharacterized protein n=1 Tax=Planococcus antarcticus DSM 14505 TaxID=1185653 RepID=A0ABM6D1Y7_9BACL|nr:hypothetical protein [Planococcus antarcticus]ANU09406.1 hypothetical protein BBH88_03315 [Planococcus antarcticus DSM 14505]
MNNSIKYQKEIETWVSSLQKGETFEESYKTNSVTAKLLITTSYNHVLDIAYFEKYLLPGESTELVNYLSALAILNTNKGEPDPYYSEYDIGRFVASVYVKDKECFSEKENLLQKLLKQLESSSVRPNCVFIHDGHFEIAWYPKGSLVVMDYYQYAALVLEFAIFLNESPIDGLLLKNTCGETPNNEINFVNNGIMDCFPEFNSYYFGSSKGEAIEVISYRRQFFS